MSDTAKAIITAAMRKLGAIASGEALSPDEAADGLSALNLMLESWSNEQLLVVSKVREVFALSGAQTYTMGTGGTWNTSRPQKIEEAYLQLVSSSPALELPMEILTKEQYAEIALKALTSTFPSCLYADYAYPLCTISVWPVPTENDNVVLYSWKPLSKFSALTTEISLPPGYEEALIYNLAVRLAPEFAQPLSETVAEIAIASKAAIKRMNSKPRYLKVDSALRPMPAGWNWRTGDPV